MKCIFSIDVEDWFHILDLPSTPRIREWDFLTSRVERNFLRLLEILADNNTRVTCFFLGWVAQKFPHLVLEAANQGHEIASHGYSHRLVYQMTPRDFQEDAVRARKIIEDAGGQPVSGYRASGFSVTQETPWFFEKLVEAGYRYDSSVFPAPRGHGGLPSGCYAPYRIEESSDFVEFPISVEPVVGRPMCFFGGGYLRLFPYPVIRSMTRRILRQGRPVIFYVHPREIDPGFPRLTMGMKRRFKSYVNLASTETKIKKILSEFEITTFQEFLMSSVKGWSPGYQACLPAVAQVPRTKMLESNA
jgi:polysaccharide deacetylase family protein (PEP-CTERM system associated)